MKKILSIMIATSLTACSLAPDAVIPEGRIPEAWRGNESKSGKSNASESSESMLAPLSWSDYGSAELAQLVKQALDHNTDISAALARIDQARAITQIASAALYPAVDISGNASRTTTDSRDTRSITTRRSDATLAISYELDVWQRNRNQSDSAWWAARASDYDYQALQIIVVSEVARLYTGYLALNARIDVAEKNLATARDVLRITELRYAAGAISGLERAQQKTSVANTEAAIASLTNQRNLFFNQLALVVGLAPASLTLADATQLAQLQLPVIGVSKPWELLARRPDIAAAEARLRAANKDIGVARANALPSLSLAMNAGVVGNPSGTLLGLAASFFAPIFQGGALQGEIDRSEAVRDEQNAQYETTLLVAFREVEDALSTVEAAGLRRAALFTAAEEARIADSIARARFDAGSIDYTTLLQTQTALLQAEDGYFSSLQDEFAAHSDLMRALGGKI